MMAVRSAVVFAAVALAGCGHAGGGASSSWKATDACAILDKSVVAATLGSAVSSAELSAVHADGGGSGLYSQCAYTLADGRMLVFGTGQSTDGSSLSDQVEHLRKQASAVTDKKPVDLPGVGKAAFWAPELGAVYTFFGDGRFASASFSQPDFRKPQPSATQTQATDTAILRKVDAQG